MNNRNCISICVGFSILFYGVTAHANNEFQQWMQQQSNGVAAQKKEFQEYKDKRDKEFTSFLKSQWKSVDLVKGDVRDEAPKPDVMPVAEPEPVKKLTVPPKSLPVPVVITVPKPIIIKPPVIAPVIVKPEGKSLTITFYGKALRFYYDASMRQNLSSNINKDVVSHYWSALSRTKYENLLKQIKEQKKILQLNDWAFASLVNQIAVKITNNKRNESALLNWFILAKTGFKARVAYNQSAVYLLVPDRKSVV